MGPAPTWSDHSPEAAPTRTDWSHHPRSHRARRRPYFVMQSQAETAWPPKKDFFGKGQKRCCNRSRLWYHLLVGERRAARTTETSPR